jgi:hypothetical protein
MIVHICNMLLSRIEKHELVKVSHSQIFILLSKNVQTSSITGYGTIHAAILGLASNVLQLPSLLYLTELTFE